MYPGKLPEDFHISRSGISPEMIKALKETKDWILTDEQIMEFYGDYRIRDTKKILLEFANSQGQDNCWWHPDLLRKLCEIWEIPLGSMNLPPRDKFQEGCKKFEEEIYDKKEI